MILRRVDRFFDERLGSDAWVRYVFAKLYPDHWSFYLGEFALYCFVMLVATGVWLTFVFQPSHAGAFASVIAFTRATPVGYLMRQVHHWSAVAFIAAIVVHLGRVFFTAAFRKPREITWVLGVLLLVTASVTGFTGYSLPDDTLSGTGLRIADAVLLSIPFIGGWAADLLNGGGYPGPLLIPHLYVIHVYFLPVTIGALLALHLGLVFYQKHTQFEPDPAHVVVGRRFWPDYTLRTLAVFFATAGVVTLLGALIEINPVENYGPYHDWLVTNPAAPDWYAAWLDGALRLGPAVEWRIFGHPVPAVFWPGMVLPTLAFLLVVAWPWIDKTITKRDEVGDVLVPPTAAPWRVGVGAALVTAGVVLTLAASDDQQAVGAHVRVTALVTLYRILFPFGSIAVGLIAALLAAELRASRAGRGAERERVVELVRNAEGGFDAREPHST
ncbi:MAG: cytochrome bc complex cytochrome b subunit [Candidatus Eremiobacteraeota bacterium]|nr:cytochrome bc complex cytochrome b subunit [Candidatus Eremiobacteraeota bacterium]